jgi:hypothetical protein
MRDLPATPRRAGDMLDALTDAFQGRFMSPSAK